MVFQNISYTVKHKLCTGCGLCADVCPTNVIGIKIKGGVYQPCVSETGCIGCGKCINICPGVGVQVNKIARDLFTDSKIKCHPGIGRYISCHTGYSNDHAIRYHSASGGLVTQILLGLMERGLITGAVVTSFDKTNFMLFRPNLALDKDAVIQGKSSKYSPVNFEGVIKEIQKNTGKFIIVGLPCHIHAFRKYEVYDKHFKEKILGYFGLYCSAGRTFNMTEYLFQRYGVDKNKLTYFAFRDEGCLGHLVARFSGMEVRKKYEDYYTTLRSFFIPRRCLLCVDHFAELADVSFGDIHIPPYSDDKIGINSLIIRNRFFYELIQKMASSLNASDSIVLHDLDEKLLLASQRVLFQKKHRLATFLTLEKLRKKVIPLYDVDLSDTNTFKSFISYVHTLLQLKIGKYKCLWWVIDLLKKKKGSDI